MAHKAGLNKLMIVSAAADLIDAEGLAALTLARLAERLGVKSPSLYKHVANLEEIQRGVAVQAVQACAKWMTQSAIGKSRDEAIMAIAEAFRSFAKEHPGLYTAILRAPAPEDAALVAASDELLGIIRAVFAPYGLDEIESIHAIRGFRSLVHGFVSLETASGFDIPVEIDASFRYMIEMFLKGLKTATHPNSRRIAG